MSVEIDLATALLAVCAGTYPDVAPHTTPTPYLVWTRFGGRPVSYVEGALPDQCNTFVRITAWTTSRLESNALMQQVELALVQASVFQARPMSNLQSMYDADAGLRGSTQDFDIWAPR